MENNELKDLLAALYKDFKKYLDVKFEYYKFTFIEKIIFIIKKLFNVFLFMLIMPSVMLFASIGGAIYLGQMLGATYLGFFAVAGCLLVIAIIIRIFKKVAFINPLIRVLVEILFDSDKPADKQTNVKEKIKDNAKK